MSVASPPNPRVQRTRSSPSARHSPLTRHPVGGLEWLAVLFTFVILTCTSSCASTSAVFGSIDPLSPPILRESLSRVSENLTVGEIFRVLGPAHRCESGTSGFDTMGCPSGSRCWEWWFESGERLAIPVESNPAVRPKVFRVWLVDNASLSAR